MSAQTATVVPLPLQRAPQAQPVQKLRAFEHLRALICEGELQHIDMNVVQYLAEITDKKTGAACVEYATIAERIGRSRATVIRSVRRLIDFGVIEREAQRRGKRCYASIYRPVDPSNEIPPDKCETPRFTDEPTPVHQCTTSRAFDKYLFPNGSYPYRGRIAQIGRWSARDWDDCAEWLALHGKYRRWGPGPGEAFSLAMQDLDRWRDRSGDGAVIAAIERAKIGNGGTGWFGDYLITRLEEMLDNG
jgi:predicted transcriptional regulator